MTRILSVFLAFLLLCAGLPHAAAESDLPAAALIEAQTGMCIGGTNCDLPLPAGSQVKLMTVLLTARAAASGKFTPDTLISAPAAAQKQDGAVIWLTAGEQMSVRDLLKGVIIGNANDAAYTLALAVSGSEERFVADMNAAAADMGLTGTVFADATGLSAESRCTARGLCLIARELLRFDFLSEMFAARRDFLRDGKTELVSENALLRSFDGILGMKAGHGTASGYTLTAAASRGGMTVIAAVLGETDSDARFSAGSRLLRSGFSDYRVTTPDFSAEFLRPVRVTGGLSRAVIAEPAGLRAITAKNGCEITCTVVLPAFAEAPVQQGDVLGTAAFYAGDTYLYEVPLLAADSVPARGFRDSAGILLANMFK